MHFIPATAFLTAIFALMLTILSLFVSFRRRDLKVGLGDANDATLRQRIRAHGNFVENAPLIILLCAALEITGTLNPTGLRVLVAAFIIARLFHALGVLKILVIGSQAIGMLLQHIAMLAGTFILLAGLFY
ncbi:MAPEG family protein [Thalassospira sp.]|uniref:MAPEG family protein n=1 Tax=Thalassospira sp. TaxID=1912094 RepID=UPI003AA8FD37